MIEMENVKASFQAGEDFTSASLHLAVNIDSAGTSDTGIQVETAGNGENAVGFLETYDVTGKDVAVVTDGICKAVAAAAVTVNAPLKVAAGKLTPCTTDKDQMVAYALTAAAADGEIFLIQIARGFYAA